MKLLKQILIIALVSVMPLCSLNAHEEGVSHEVDQANKVLGEDTKNTAHEHSVKKESPKPEAAPFSTTEVNKEESEASHAYKAEGASEGEVSTPLPESLPVQLPESEENLDNLPLDEKEAEDFFNALSKAMAEQPEISETTENKN